MHPQDEEKEDGGKSISLGMPMHPQEKEIENKEQKVHEKEEWELPISPPIYDSNPKTQNSLVFYGTCYYDECDDDMSIINFYVPNNDFNDNEYILDMPYDNALDDGPILLDNPPCLEITSLCEDINKNVILAVCNGTLTHESPISFLSSPIYTREEKYALCEK